LFGLLGGGLLTVAGVLLAAKLLRKPVRTDESQRLAEQADREFQEGNVRLSLQTLQRLAEVTAQPSNVWFRVGQLTEQLKLLEGGNYSAESVEALRRQWLAEREGLIRGVIFVEALTNALLISEATNTTEAARRLLEKAAAQRQEGATVEAVREVVEQRARERAKP